MRARDRYKLPGVTDASRAEMLLTDAQWCGSVAVGLIRLLGEGMPRRDKEKLTVAAINQARLAASAALERDRILAKLKA